MYSFLQRTIQTSKIRQICRFSLFLQNLQTTSSQLSHNIIVSNHSYNYGFHQRSIVSQNQFRCFGSESDSITVEGIIANNWNILDEDDGDWKSHAASVAQSIDLIKRRLQWKKLKVRLDLLSAQLTKPDLWDDPVHAGKISREHGSLLGKVKEVNALEQELIEHIDMIKLAREENDEELESESLKALLNMRRNAKEKELEALLSGEHDYCSCYIEVQAGAGGTESMDWASMVMQMYKSWAQRRGYKVIVMEEMAGELAGIKRATIKVDGEFAFGYAKAEIGVHRLVRISPFDSNKRRHTSFAAVAVIPILGDGSTRVQINESDLRIERFRSGGPGGQHANTTDSAVRIIHIPTGITATSQNERSQHMNKASALAVLQSRLDQIEMARQAQLNAQHTQSLTDITWGSQIRSYVLHPYRMVKDLRTNYEVSDPDSVLEGDIDAFILSYLSASLDKDENNVIPHQILNQSLHKEAFDFAAYCYVLFYCHYHAMDFRKKRIQFLVLVAGIIVLSITAKKCRQIVGEKASSQSGKFTFLNCFDMSTGTIACGVKEGVKLYVYNIRTSHVEKERHNAIQSALIDAASQGMSTKDSSKLAEKEGKKAAKLASRKAERITGPIISSGWDFFEAVYYGGTVAEGFFRGSCTSFGAYGGGFIGEKKLGRFGYLIGSLFGSWFGGRIGLMLYDVFNALHFLL
ncbi:hypothetical protein Lal_00036263 [Lupinus albus]|nr:hypothetical protein Lal_00036263 [Lupinus albus]